MCVWYVPYKVQRHAPLRHSLLIFVEEEQCAPCEARNKFYYVIWMGAHCDPIGRGTTLKVEMSQFRFPMVSFQFFFDIILPAAPWP